MKTTGIFTWFGFVLKFEEKLKLIKNAGFDTICTWWGNDFDLTDGNYLEHPEIADRFGLSIEHTHIPYYQANDIWYDNLNGESLIKKYRKDISDAKYSGVDTLVIHPFEKDPPNFKEDHLCIERFKMLADYAGDHGIYLAIENLANNEVLKKIITSVSHPHAGICFDSGHNHIINQDDFSLLNDFKDKIFALHLHDNDTYSDQHLLPFEGTINWNEFIQQIIQTDYCKSFMLEASRKYDHAEFENEADMTLLFSSEKEAAAYLESAQKSCQKAISNA